MSAKSLNFEVSTAEQKKRTQRRFVDQFLLAIINGNAHHDASATLETRLAQAREALFGDRPKKGRKEKLDEVDRFYVASEKNKKSRDHLMRGLRGFVPTERVGEWDAEILRKEKSERSIGAERIDKDRKKSPILFDSAPDRFRKKARDRPFTVKDMADIEGIAYENSTKVEFLLRILEDLKRLGIQVEPVLGRKPSN